MSDQLSHLSEETLQQISWEWDMKRIPEGASGVKITAEVAVDRAGSVVDVITVNSIIATDTWQFDVLQQPPIVIYHKS
jgi:hypothetical protein